MSRNLTRRAFLRLTAGSSLAYAAGGIGIQFPANWISEPLPPELNIKPVNLIRYATTCRECPAGCGMHIRHINGRSIKAEGNPDHPVNRGGLCARGQSSLQGLYDPDRLTEPLQRISPAAATFPDTGMIPLSWQQALQRIGKSLQNTKGRVLVISDLETGPLADIMRKFASNYNGELHLYEPFDYRPQREIYDAATGSPVIPWYALDKCECILSFATDFLEAWVSNVQFTWMFTKMHTFTTEKKMGNFSYIGPRLSMTATSADDFLKVPPGAEYSVAMNILKVMAERGWTHSTDFDYQALTREFTPESLPVPDAAARIESLAEKFSGSGNPGRSVALAGPIPAAGERSQQLAQAVFMLNQAAGNFGKTIDFTRVHALSQTTYQKDLNRLLENLTSDDIVIFHQANPVYVQPELETAIGQAGLVIALAQMPDETTRSADLILPVDNPLESWGEYSPWTGIRGFMQPTMKRLYNSRAAGDIFLSMADIGGRPLSRQENSESALNFASWLRSDWQEISESDERKGQQILPRLLRAGFLKNSDTGADLPEPKPRSIVTPPTPDHIYENHDVDTAELWVWPSIFFFDGRTSNRTWLQENPQPVSYIVWDSWIDIHPVKAAALEIKEGDGLKISTGKIMVQAPVRITEEIHEHTVGLAIGQGHWALGKIAAGRGINGFSLLDENEKTHMFGKVSISRVKELGKPICLTSDREQHEREILRWEKLSVIQAGRQLPRKIDMPLPEGYNKKNDIYKGHKHAGHRWAMVIDLHRCIGCGACAVACYAENNLPILYPESVREGREIAWLKVIPYNHPIKKDRVGFLPLPCQHCDQAPCEPVCPVFASVHTEDGLNAQVYNRCIGTRYCSQNCPYKVRRFNWFNTTWTPPLEWQLNPEVTVRCRGVMEKCTFCVQRIRHAEYQAKREDRPIRDGEIQPACVQSCPAKVYTFGDLLNEDSAVNKLFREDKRGYQLLHELNTKTAVLYLKKIEQE